MTCCDRCGSYIALDDIHYVDFDAPGADAAELCPGCFADVRKDALWQRIRYARPKDDEAHHD